MLTTIHTDESDEIREWQINKFTLKAINVLCADTPSRPDKPHSSSFLPVFTKLHPTHLSIAIHSRYYAYTSIQYVLFNESAYRLI